MAISAKIDPNLPIRRHYDEPGPDSPREPGDQPDQKLLSRDARKLRRTGRASKMKKPAAGRGHREAV